MAGAAEMGGAADLLDPRAPEWADALERTGHDVYHLPEYVTLDARLAGGTPAAFRYAEADGVLLLPLVIRPVPGSDVCDASSPYGYPGPVSDVRPEDTQFWARACGAMVALLRAHHIVTVFVRAHPWLPAAVPALRSVGAVVRHGRTVSVDLTDSIEQMWRQTRRDHRKDINRARRTGVKVVVDDWTRLDEWLVTYHDAMHRIGADEYYFFPAEHFRGLRESLGGRVHLAVALLDDEVLGGTVFFEHRGIMQGYVQAARRDPLVQADKLLYDELRRWGKERGNTVFHFGGGVGGADDSLFDYKAGFSDRRHLFCTWRVVTDPVRYADLLGADAPSDVPSPESGYFPAYR